MNTIGGSWTDTELPLKGKELGNWPVSENPQIPVSESRRAANDEN